MKTLLIATSLLFALPLALSARNSTQVPASDDNKVIKDTVEVSCGQCNFKMKGEGCSMAVRIDGKTYFIDGAAIDDFGDAHAEDGFCSAIRKAVVEGEIVKNRFKATKIELLPLEKKED